MIHQLKTEQSYFQATIDGLKPFEVRRADRDFQVGDFLALNECSLNEDGTEAVETGRCCLLEITYMLQEERFVKSGFVMLGTRPCMIGRRTRDMLHMRDGDYYAVTSYGEETRRAHTGA